MPGDVAPDAAVRPVLSLEPAVDVMRNAELIRRHPQPKKTASARGWPVAMKGTGRTHFIRLGVMRKASKVPPDAALLGSEKPLMSPAPARSLPQTTERPPPQLVEKGGLSVSGNHPPKGDCRKAKARRQIYRSHGTQPVGVWAESNPPGPAQAGS